MAGIARTDEPVTVGVPLPDTAGITSTNVLGLTGASAAQFVIEGKWPSGNLKWVKVRAVVPSVPAGGTTAITLTDSGTGNFGGANLATDAGTSIIVSTGTAVFTVKKANFNVVDLVVIGGKQVLSGGSLGLVLTGPDPAAAYPGNVTCLPTAGGSPCTTVFASANDPGSTAVIEENGPAMTVIKATGRHLDASGHAYMAFTARMYFYKNKNAVKVTSILRNADYGTGNTFATAYKGFQGYELRLAPNLTGPLTYTLANHTTTPATGTVNATTGTDSVYLYQAESTLMNNNGSWCNATGCVPYTSLSGYAIVKNGAAVSTGTSSQYPQGWADISNGSGVGVEIGQYQLAAYGNKSLEFNGGGTDVRIGMWARENNTTSTSTTTANKPYYMPWPQWSINDVLLNFHTTATSSSTLANEFLKFQHYLVAAAPISHYNNSGVFAYPLLDTAEEDSYYSSLVSSASPAINAPSNKDLGVTDYFNWPLTAWRYYSWANGGVSNQMEFRMSHMLNFLRRGFTGNYLDSAHFYKFAAEKAFPMSDGFDWRTSPANETQYIGLPTAASANKALAMRDWVEADHEHSHWYGMPDYYFLSGDETIHDGIVEGPKDSFMNASSTAGGTTSEVTAGSFWNARAVGVYLMSSARLASMLQATGDPDYTTVLNNGKKVYELQIKPDFCAYSGYPAGCTPDPYNNNGGSAARQRGVSRVRGVPYQWGDTIEQFGCSSYPKDVRDQAPFMVGIMLEGLWEFRRAMGPSWADYNQAFDLGYGTTKWAFGEMYVDNGTASWQGNGFRYKQAIDLPNTCNVGSGGASAGYYWMVQNPNAFWPIFYFRAMYEGDAATPVWQRQFNQQVQQVISGGAAIKDELYQYTVGQVIYALKHPTGLSLNTLPITGFKDNGSGSYTITWSVPAGTSSYRIKWGPKRIVDWIGFDTGAYSFIGDPVTTMNWFAANDASGIPAPAGTTQSLTIATGATGLTVNNFMVKAYVTGGGSAPPPPSDTTPPVVSMTAPAAGATVTGSVTLAATATDNVGVASVQFKLDGSPLGAVRTQAPYTLAWDSTTAGNGTHVFTASAFDAAGNGAVSAVVTVTVSNSTSSGGGTGGALSGTVAAPAGPVDLSKEGTADWAHWGLSAITDFNHKSGVTQQISNATIVGTAVPERYGNNAVGFTWMDGIPLVSATVSTTGLFIAGQNNGFSLTVPADTTQRTLKIYVGAWRTSGRLVAHLSDSSAPDYVDTSVTNSAGTTTLGVYTMNYKAAAAGKTLTVTYTQNTAANANVTLQAASLSAAATSTAPDFTVSVNPVAVSISAGGTTAPMVAVAAANGFAGAVTFSASGLPPGVTPAFNPAKVTGSGSAPLSLVTTAATVAGTYPVKITGTSGSLTHTANLDLTVVGNAPAGPPVLSSIVASGITASGVTITWLTNTASDTQVTYGPTIAYGTTSPPAAAAVTNHAVTLAGLTPSTAYHFKAVSRDAQGATGNSADLTFTTASQSSGAGTPVPMNTWTKVQSTTGWPAEIMNYDKSEYVASRKLHCVWGAYKQYLSSEHNNALVCYSYAENRWTILENNGYWHSSHAPGVGHSVSVWAYINDKDSIAFQADGSGSNSPESFAGFWWWYDMGGLSGQNKTFSPRPWLGVQTPLVEMMTYDQFHQKLILYDQAGAIEVCDPGANSCAKPTISGTPIPNNLTSPNMVYNSRDHKMYIYGGGNSNGTNVYTFSCDSNACTTATGALLAVTCTGADCVNGKPPSRLAAGMAYSSADNIFLMAGGIPDYASNSFFNDTWSFDPATLAWRELSPPTNYFATRQYFTADRLTYDAASNVFLMMSINGYTPTMFAFAYSAAANYGMTSNVYTPPAGSLNRATPTATSQSWSFDPAIASSGSNVYLGWVESGASGDNSTCGQTHHPYVQSSTNNTTWTYYPAGTMSQACTAIDPDLNGSSNASRLQLASVNGVLWEAHEKINHNQAYYSAAFARQWTGSAWTGGAVGCFFGTCGEKLRQAPEALIASGRTPTLAVIEWNRLTYTPEGYLYVAQWNGSTWAALGSKLNAYGAGAQVLEASLASDGSNPAACWSEQVVGNDRRSVTTTPQIRCAHWNGSSWAPMGTPSLNRNPSSYASDPAMTFAGGKYYVAWVERSVGGPSQLFSCRWDGATCTLLGTTTLNTGAAGWAAHPSMASDGTNVYLAWEEQPAPGKNSRGYVNKWNGSAWSQMGGALNADPVNGSAQGISLAVVQGSPVAVWAELIYGNLRQVYEKQWNGSTWTGLSGSGTPAPLPNALSCDLNGDGKVDAADVQSAIDQALGTLPCTTADLEMTGQCSVVGVQRVINASLGGSCRIGN